MGGGYQEYHHVSGVILLSFNQINHAFFIRCNRPTTASQQVWLDCAYTCHINLLNMILQPISVQQTEALTGGNVQTMVKDLKDSSQGNQYKHKVPRPKSCSEAIKSMHTTSLTVPRPYSAGNMGRCTDNHALNTHLSPLNNHLNNRDEGAPLLEVSW